MADKRLLLILVLLAIYIFGVKPYVDKIPFEMLMLKHLRKAISEEEFIKEKSRDIEKLFPKYIKVSRENRKLFFSPNTPASAAMSNIQAFIKKTSLHDGMQLIRVNWGLKEDKDGYVVLPISMTVKGYPSQLGKFLKDLTKFQKLLKFETVSVSASAFSSKLSVTAIIRCYKLKGKQK